MGLRKYRQKRHFDRTPEPTGAEAKPRKKEGRSFVIQKHAASRLHYDFRLEHDGVLKSWAVPKGPSFDPTVKSLAVQVEDHPLSYADFEGVIPQGQYGGGTVMVWDRGTWEPEGDVAKGLRNGKLSFRLHGDKLHGGWTLVQMHGVGGEDGRNWLLIKSRDGDARPAEEYDVVEKLPKSITTKRTMDQIAKQADRVWSSSGGEQKVKRAAKKAAKLAAPHKKKVKLTAETHTTRLPAKFRPELATAVTDPPLGDEWLHELKYDGYRILGRIEAGNVRLESRRNIDWTARFPTVVKSLQQLNLDNTILDGEVVVLTSSGTTDFQALQNLMRRGQDDDIVYFLFDLPFFDGHDLTQMPLIERKGVLTQLLANQSGGVLRYSDHIVGNGADVFAHACGHALEGIVSKRIDSKYISRRTTEWVKTKCLHRQEFVVGGWSEPSGSRAEFGALLLGYYEDEKLRYCGRVGTGFNSQSLADLKAELDKLVADKPPFVDPPTGADARDVHWVQPKLVVEIEFAQWTSDGILRQASFQGLREDKPPTEVSREMPKHLAEARSPASKKKARNVAAKKGTTTVAGVRLTHPDRVLYPDCGITKQELAEFYVEIADWILPYVVDRPLSLVRCPDGLGGPRFFQKHLTESMPAELHGVNVGEEEDYVMIKDLAGLVALVQMSALEVHPWPAKADRIDRPDRLVFDLDPGEGVTWKDVVQGARDVRDRLADHGLQSFLRTSGGKGLHIVAPVARRIGWNDFKAFAKSVADDLTAEFPERYIATLSKARRKGKIFIDYLRNGKGATAVASFSTRARENAPVATAVAWDELDARLKPDKFNLRNLRERLASLKNDLWEGFLDLRQSIKSKPRP